MHRRKSTCAARLTCPPSSYSVSPSPSLSRFLSPFRSPFLLSFVNVHSRVHRQRRMCKLGLPTRFSDYVTSGRPTSATYCQHVASTTVETRQLNREIIIANEPVVSASFETRLLSGRLSIINRSRRTHGGFNVARYQARLPPRAGKTYFVEDERLTYLYMHRGCTAVQWRVYIAYGYRRRNISIYNRQERATDHI